MQQPHSKLAGNSTLSKAMEKWFNRMDDLFIRRHLLFNCPKNNL